VADVESPLSPLKIAEYQALGVPVVASGGGGILESVTPGASGLVVPSANAAALAAAIRSLRNDPALARRLAAGGRRRMSGRTWPKIAGRIARAVPRMPKRRVAAPAPAGYAPAAEAPLFMAAGGSDRSRS
jgi:glycosyltransferase involved in cell wall biosynthesis